MIKSPIEAVSSDIKNKFESIPDWSARTKYLIALGLEFPKADGSLTTEDNRIVGCQSQVWMSATSCTDTGDLKILAYSDSVLMRGIISLLLRLYSDRPCEEILAHDGDVFSQIGLNTYLAPGRANGLNLMIERIKDIARENRR